MLAIVDEVTDSVHLMDMTWREFFALAISIVNTAQLTDSHEVHSLIDPMIECVDSATEQVLVFNEAEAAR